MNDQLRSRAAAALRAFGHAFISRDMDDDLLRRVAEVAEQTTAELLRAPARTRDLLATKQSMFDVDIADRERISHFDECFVSGQQNPMGIAIEVYNDGGDVEAHVQLGPAFEGAPGRSHGGIVAAIFDDVLGYLLTVHKTPAFTGELTIRYRAATPIDQPLTFRAKIERVEGRKIFTSGEARSEAGTIVATATATFIQVDISNFKA